MSIWKRLTGGWRTWGPGSGHQPGAFDSGSLDLYESVARDSALALSAVWACMHLRAETIGTLPIHIRDKDKKIITDHDLHDLLRESPNAMMTGPEYWSQQIASIDMEGNGFSIISRRGSGVVTSLDPIPAEEGVELKFDERKREFYYEIAGVKFKPDDILHLKGFSTRGHMGLSRLDVGRRVLAAQLTANESAQRAFKQSLKIGGFLVPDANLTPEQVTQLQTRLNSFAENENYSRYMVTLKGMKPISGKDFRISPADAELLQTRYYGIEEICRIFNVPPQLIGHSDKASSWASSIENINLHYLAYSVVPTCIRAEARIRKQLMSRADRVKGLEVKFAVDGIARADMQTRQAFYHAGITDGWLNPDEVRDLEDRGKIEGGDKYRDINAAPTGPAQGNANGSAQPSKPAV